MKDQLLEAIELFGEEIEGNVLSIATHNIFKVDENTKPLDRKKREIFHSVIEKLLFITKRGRPDLETLIYIFNDKSIKKRCRRLEEIEEGFDVRIKVQ